MWSLAATLSVGTALKGIAVLRLTKISLAHRTVVLLLSLLTIALGVYAAGALKQELIPSIDLPRGSVLTVFPGAAPDVPGRPGPDRHPACLYEGLHEADRHPHPFRDVHLRPD